MILESRENFPAGEKAHLIGRIQQIEDSQKVDNYCAYLSDCGETRFVPLCRTGYEKCPTHTLKKMEEFLERNR